MDKNKKHTKQWDNLMEEVQLKAEPEDVAPP